MKDPTDKKTLSLFADQQQKRRGRPPEGPRSRTAAERKAEQRKRDRERVLDPYYDLNEWTKKDCLIVLNDPSMSLDMQKIAVRQLGLLLENVKKCDGRDGFTPLLCDKPAHKVTRQTQIWADWTCSNCGGSGRSTWD